MKKFLAFLLALCMLSACLIGCGSDKDLPDASKNPSEPTGQTSQLTPDSNGGQAYIVGKVIEVHQSGYLLKVTDPGNWQCKVGTLVSVTADVSESAEFSMGDHLKVTFDASEPLRTQWMIDSASSIEKVNP